jgi:hypothetical protein
MAKKSARLDSFAATSFLSPARRAVFATHEQDRMAHEHAAQDPCASTGRAARPSIKTTEVWILFMVLTILFMAIPVRREQDRLGPRTKSNVA